MAGHADGEDPQAEALIEQIRERAGNLYETRQLLCSEAVVVTLNNALDGGLNDAQAVAVAAPFSVAMGCSGCMCGALSGAVLACGLFVGGDQLNPGRRLLRKHARYLHDAFKEANGATCCRVLTRNVRHDRRAHFRHCACLTADTAAMAARLIIQCRPELIRCAGNGFLHTRDSRIGTIIRQLGRIAKVAR